MESFYYWRYMMEVDSIYSCLQWKKERFAEGVHLLDLHNVSMIVYAAYNF